MLPQDVGESEQVGDEQHYISCMKSLIAWEMVA